MQAIIIIIIASYPSIQLILPLLLIAPCIKMLLAFLVFLFSKVSRETFLQMLLLKNRATKMWYTSQLSLATRLLQIQAGTQSLMLQLLLCRQQCIACSEAETKSVLPLLLLPTPVAAGM